MSDYISREAAVKIAQKYGLVNGSALGRHTGLADCIAIKIKGLPAADVEPVRRSYWESYDTSQYMGTDEFGEPKWRPGRFYVCHDRRCRRKTVVKSNYRPNCGAKMRAGDDDNEFVPLDEDEDDEDYWDV